MARERWLAGGTRWRGGLRADDNVETVGIDFGRIFLYFTDRKHFEGTVGVALMSLLLLSKLTTTSFSLEVVVSSL
jgi:hypothetical protein